jgi:uncharacterized protein (DUF2062 family)
MEKIKNFFRKFFLIDDSPHKIAAGAALGIFLGIIPGEGVLTTLVLASFFGLNRLSATAGVLATNMWTTVFVLPAAASIGSFLFHDNPEALINNFHSSYHLGWKYFFSKIIFLDLVLPLAIGYLIISLLLALAFYFLIYFLLKYNKVKFK